MSRRPSVKDFSQESLTSLFADLGEPAYRGRQLLSWLYAKGVSGWDAMTSLRKPLREELARRLDLDDPVVDRELVSTDGTRKFTLKLRDGERVESVLIPEEKRMTLCVSTQAGCRRGCRLCATATMGFRRNLTPGEILNQLIAAQRKLPEGRRLSNLVFMGMGEPMDNLDAVLASLKIIHSDHGFVISPGRVTVSTVGVIEGIDRLAREGGGVGLAVSLHAGDDETRKKLIPLAQKVGLADLIDAARRYGRAIDDKVTFEYVMVRGLNCSPDDGRRLAKLLASFPAKINLIPYNNAVDRTFEPPTDAEIDAFKEELFKGPTIVTVRRSRGRDIQAACGQLCAATDKS